MPLIVSAPAATRHAKASHSASANPKPTIATPQPRGPKTTARPWRCTRAVQPLVSVTTIAPADGAAYSSPRTSAPP